MHLELRDQILTPGGTIVGELRLHGPGEAVEIDRLWAKLWARVYSDFDDDLGAAQVVLFDQAVAEKIHLRPRQHTRIPLQLPVAWHTPVTRLDGECLRGISIILLVWAKDLTPSGDATLFLPAEPLPWQRAVLDACRRLGLRIGTTYASGISQDFNLDADDPGVPPLRLSWRVQRRRLTVVLHRRYGSVYGSLHLTHEQAAAEPWEQRLSGWLGRPR
jgi:sporulation-control protein spo0M